MPYPAADPRVPNACHHPQSADLTVKEATAVNKALRAEMSALLKLKRKPFEDLLMDLYSRDQLIALHRRIHGVPTNREDDPLARRTKRWTKREFAGEIYQSLHLSSLVHNPTNKVAGAVIGAIFGYTSNSDNFTTGAPKQYITTARIISGMCIAIGAGIGQLADFLGQQGPRSNFVKELRTLRAKRPSALTRRLPHLVKQSTTSKQRTTSKPPSK